MKSCICIMKIIACILPGLNNLDSSLAQNRTKPNLKKKKKRNSKDCLSLKPNECLNSICGYASFESNVHKRLADLKPSPKCCLGRQLTRSLWHSPFVPVNRNMVHPVRNRTKGTCHSEYNDLSASLFK